MAVTDDLEEGLLLGIILSFIFQPPPPQVLNPRYKQQTGKATLEEEDSLILTFEPELQCEDYTVVLSFRGAPGDAVPGYKQDATLATKASCRMLLTGDFTGTVLWSAEVLSP